LVQSETEVDQNYGILFEMSHNILKLQITVDQSAVMHGLQAFHHLDADCYDCLELKLLSLLLEESLQVYVVSWHQDEIESLICKLAIRKEFRIQICYHNIVKITIQL
jgi:hypothetical protein